MKKPNFDSVFIEHCDFMTYVPFSFLDGLALYVSYVWKRSTIKDEFVLVRELEIDGSSSFLDELKFGIHGWPFEILVSGVGVAHFIESYG